MIHVIAMLEAAPGKRDEFLAIFHALLPKVHAEPGCIEYILTVDVPTSISTQKLVGENVVTVVEKWESVAALETHSVAPHVLEFREKVKDIVVDTKLLILEPA